MKIKTQQKIFFLEIASKESSTGISTCTTLTNNSTASSSDFVVFDDNNFLILNSNVEMPAQGDKIELEEFRGNRGANIQSAKLPAIQAPGKNISTEVGTYKLQELRSAPIKFLQQIQNEIYFQYGCRFWFAVFSISLLNA